MLNTEKYRTLNQDEWKRTQVRMPQEVYDSLTDFAKNKKLSLNSALITVLEDYLSNPDKNAFTAQPTMQEIRTNYYVQKVYGLIYVVQNLESTVQNFKYLISTAETEKDKEKFRILLEFSQNNLANAQERIQSILEGLSLSMFDENNQQFLQSLIKKPTL